VAALIIGAVAFVVLQGGGNDDDVATGSTPTAEATGGATTEATIDATTEATDEATVEATDEATTEVTTQATVEATDEATTPALEPVAPVIETELSVGDRTTILASAGGQVWAADPDTGTLHVFEASGRFEIATIEVGPAPGPPAAIDNLAVVATRDGQAHIVELGPEGELTERGAVAVGADPDGPFAAFGVFWVASIAEGTVTRIDPQDLSTVVAEVGAEPAGLAVTGDAVAVPNRGDGSVSILDPQTGELVVTLDTELVPKHLVEAGDVVVVTDLNEGFVATVDPASQEVLARRRLGRDLFRPIYVDGLVYTTSNIDGVLYALDPRTLDVVARQDVGNDPTEPSFAAGHIWVSNRASREDSSPAVRAFRPGTLEPAGLIDTGLPEGLRAAMVVGDELWVPAPPAGVIVVVVPRP
jgi:DNA-binding beta-propeller fold protein YncE